MGSQASKGDVAAEGNAAAADAAAVKTSKYTPPGLFYSFQTKGDEWKLKKV